MNAQRISFRSPRRHRDPRCYHGALDLKLHKPGLQPDTTWYHFARTVKIACRAKIPSSTASAPAPARSVRSINSKGSGAAVCGRGFGTHEDDFPQPPSAPFGGIDPLRGEGKEKFWKTPELEL